MIDTIVLVPAFDNDGAPFPAAAFREFEARTLDAFGGWSEFLGDARGAWRDEDGTAYPDGHRVYQISVPFNQLGEFIALVQWTRQRFGQFELRVAVEGHFHNVGPAL
ncbi:MAG: hypothetical protein ACRDHF_08460 [Tepidiformaceae bacterium]